MLYEGEDDEPVCDDKVDQRASDYPHTYDIEAGGLYDSDEVGGCDEYSQAPSTIEPPNQCDADSFDQGPDDYGEYDIEAQDYDEVEDLYDEEDFDDEHPADFDEFALEDCDLEDRKPESPTNAEAVQRSGRGRASRNASSRKRRKK